MRISNKDTLYILIEMNFTYFICPVIIGHIKRCLADVQFNELKGKASNFQAINLSNIYSLIIYNIVIKYYLLQHYILGHNNNSRLSGIQLALENGTQIQTLEPCHDSTSTCSPYLSQNKTTEQTILSLLRNYSPIREDLLLFQFHSGNRVNVS